MFFFFKQKTAYEMRISDWSSDVCSSDLAEKPSAASSSDATSMNGTLRTANSEMRIDGALLDDAHGFAIGEICRAIGDDARAGGQRLLERGAIIGDEDRTSVVSGKRVSERVDLGGRRIRKKKKNTI